MMETDRKVRTQGCEDEEPVEPDAMPRESKAGVGAGPWAPGVGAQKRA